MFVLVLKFIILDIIILDLSCEIKPKIEPKKKQKPRYIYLSIYLSIYNTLNVKHLFYRSVHEISCGEFLSLSSVPAALVFLRYKSEGMAKLSPHCFLRASLFISTAVCLQMQ